MSQTSKNSTIGVVVAILLGLLIAKSAWVIAELKYLPKQGINLSKDSGIKKLYYHYTLATKKDKRKVVKNNPVKKEDEKPKPEEFTKFTLTGLYNASDKKVILVSYKGKSYALSLNEEIEGYKFIKLFENYAIFSKNKKEYRLDIYKKSSNNSSYQQPESHNSADNKPNKISKKDEPVQEGGVTYIPKNLFNKYKGDIGSIRRNIDAVPNMENGKLNGFKISFVKKGSDFDKLGLKRGDILTAINGEALDNFRVPLEFFRNADSLSAATLTVKRGNEIKELEYEVR